MTIDALAPMLHVRDVSASILHYQRLGFELTAAVPSGGEDGDPVWARLAAGAAVVMLTRSDAPLDPDQQGVMVFLYVDDVDAYASALSAAGLEVGEVERPPSRPGGMLRLVDPDGYVLVATVR